MRPLRFPTPEGGVSDAQPSPQDLLEPDLWLSLSSCPAVPPPPFSLRPLLAVPQTFQASSCFRAFERTVPSASDLSSLDLQGCSLPQLGPCSHVTYLKELSLLPTCLNYLSLYLDELLTALTTLLHYIAYLFVAYLSSYSITK